LKNELLKEIIMTETDSKEVTKQESSEVKKRQRDADTVLRPFVDIFEDAGGITLLADMPGVSRERLKIEVGKDVLLVEGDARIDMPDNMEALYADVRSTRYRCSFGLSGELDTDEIEASLKDGVLSVHIPKRAELRPRKIEVSVG
jgi:HSP20 family molecular chaperone IbpA